ncbi:dihydrolipoamide acetyltransferase family protein [Bacillus sp. 1P06AnD]|uniref:dihydrolipoamide acetyltransferase family protein n=1 Tax=Bacillus sp. 1P06AnD TaxID=3132208 RepID=UPI0039A3508D
MVEVKLHDIGEGMTEGEITSYLIKEGDPVTIDEPLVEVQTDKVVAELPSPISGIVKQILFPVGSTVSVGTTLLTIEPEHAGIKHQQIKEDHKKTLSLASPIVNQKRILATPYTRKIARENGINLDDVPSSDPSGRITEEDVLRHMKQPAKQKSVALQETVKRDAVDMEYLPFTGIRRQIAQKMTKSLFTIPHVTQFEEVNMTSLMKVKEELKSKQVPVSISSFLIKALTIALRDFPIFNSKLDDEQERIILEKQMNIGIAVDTEKGLVVPVIRQADQQSIRQLSESISEANRKAKEGSLSPWDYKGGTFTVSNVGPLGSIAATPIINYPESAIIAFHKTRKIPIVNDEDQITIGHMMNISMSFDHRIADGATAIAFTNRFKALIEQPARLLVELI